jgi:hypothetical protein
MESIVIESIPFCKGAAEVVTRLRTGILRIPRSRPGADVGVVFTLALIRDGSPWRERRTAPRGDRPLGGPPPTAARN